MLGSVKMDIEYLYLLQRFRDFSSGIFNNFFVFITDLGDGILPVLVMALVYWCFDKKIGSFLIGNAYIGKWVNGVIKLTACVYRPWIRSSKIHPLEAARGTATGYSFPSGHTTNAVGVWGGLAVSFRKNKLIRNMFILLVLLIGFSRNYVGVHSPQDVIVALITESLVLLGNFYLIKWLDKDSKRDIFVVVAGIAMCVFMILYASLKKYPLDYVDGKLLVDPAVMAVDSWKAGGMILGFGIGWFAERRWVKFTTDVPTTEKICRLVVGSLLLVFLYYSLSPFLMLFLPKTIVHLLSQSIIALYIMFLYPLCFSRVNRRK